MEMMVNFSKTRPETQSSTLSKQSEASIERQISRKKFL